MKFLERALALKLKELISKFLVIFLTGPRKSGKSTLLNTFFSLDFSYVDLREKKSREFAINDPKGFINSLAGTVILDEIQRAPLLIPYIRDKAKEKRIPDIYILSGCLNSSLKRNITDLLKGRAVKLSLLPFSLAELENAGRPPKNLNEWLFTGAYPERTLSNVNPEYFFHDYLNAFIEQDIKSENKIYELDKFKRFLTVVAVNSGNPVNYSKLGEEVFIDARTANSWISLLEENYILFRLAPYAGASEKRYIKASKLYFYDSGFLCSLLGFSRPEELNLHRMRHRIFETAVISEIAKKYSNAGFRPKLYYWRDLDNSEKEISLIEESSRGLKLTAIECSQTASKEYSKGLLNFSAQASIISRRVIYDGDDGPVFSETPYVNWRSM
jgi:predicted AAA+ superfamily ATPase